jgi:hypothetical protein
MKVSNIFLTVLSLATVSFAQEIGIAKTSVENLPEGYGEVFTQFLSQNLESSEAIQKGKDYLFTIYPSISWEGKAYNVCFKTYKVNSLYSSQCITVNYAEDIYDRLKTLSNSEFFRLKNLKQQQISVKVKLDKPINYDKVKITSLRGDSLTRYISVVKNGKSDLDLGNASLNLNIVILSEEGAEKLFKSLLENKKVESLVLE